MSVRFVNFCVCKHLKLFLIVEIICYTNTHHSLSFCSITIIYITRRVSHSHSAQKNIIQEGRVAKSGGVDFFFITNKNNNLSLTAFIYFNCVSSITVLYSYCIYICLCIWLLLCSDIYKIYLVQYTTPRWKGFCYYAKKKQTKKVKNWKIKKIWEWINHKDLLSISNPYLIT